MLSNSASLAATELARGDRAWAQRAEGQVDGEAAAEPIRAAIDAYATAVAVEPRSLEASWKLLRALWFSANFTIDDLAAKRRIYERAGDESERSLGLFAEHFGDRERLSAATPRSCALASRPTTP